jgi:hypothetical protein
MDLDTKFASSLHQTIFSLDETKSFLSDHQTEEIVGFVEDLVVEETNKEFSVKIDGGPLKFTRDSFFEFCTLLGISRAFAYKIPNDLLLECIVKMLDTSIAKIRFIVRDKDVICQCKKEAFSRLDSVAFIQEADGLLRKNTFREASISDHRVSFLLEPKESPTIRIADDPFEVGISFSLGLGEGLITGNPYSLRHCCTNIASSLSKVPRQNLVQKQSQKTQGSIYSRMLENYQGDLYSLYQEELKNRLEECMKAPLLETEYCQAFNGLKPILGQEVALSLLNVDKFQHFEILALAKANTLKNSPAQVEGLNKWDTLSQISAAAKGYLGEERILLQEIGGMLL